MDIEAFFAGRPDSRAIFDAVRADASRLGPLDVAVTKSQVAMASPGAKPFAWVWIPRMYLRSGGAPLVLTFSFHERRPWSRWKEIYQAGPRRFTHHLELRSVDDVDQEVRQWLQEAHLAAKAEGPGATTGPH